jgi:hypothetical protein
MWFYTILDSTYHQAVERTHPGLYQRRDIHPILEIRIISQRNEPDVEVEEPAEEPQIEDPYPPHDVSPVDLRENNDYGEYDRIASRYDVLVIEAQCVDRRQYKHICSQGGTSNEPRDQMEQAEPSEDGIKRAAAAIFVLLMVRQVPVICGKSSITVTSRVQQRKKINEYNIQSFLSLTSSSRTARSDL